MKRYFAAIAAMILVSVCCFAQGEKKGVKPQDKNKWEEIKAEKVGFITSKLDLTVEEAQAFWPVYNKYEKDIAAANKEVRKALKELNVKPDEKVSDAEITKRIKAYSEAKEKAAKVTGAYSKDFLKVLPASKVAKLFVVEEQFMHKMIDRFGQKKYRQPSPGQPVKPGPVKPPKVPAGKQDEQHQDQQDVTTVNP
ncbi:MAG: hypothetical protein J5495_06190 [Bacteroidales bacterium]|nr:hypothetical protein [Bacteroidales bacterium]